MNKIDELVAKLRHGDGNGCREPNALMREAAQVIEELWQDSATGQFEHGRWQARAEEAEAERDAYADANEAAFKHLHGVLTRLDSYSWHRHDAEFVASTRVYAAAAHDVLATDPKEVKP